MKLRLHNDNNTDSVIYEADTIEEIKEQAKERITLPGWRNGWSEKVN